MLRALLEDVVWSLAPMASAKGLEVVCDVDRAIPDAVLVDPFAGTGTLAIASERFGLATWLVEMEPAYCEVILRRWEVLTGETALEL